MEHKYVKYFSISRLIWTQRLWSRIDAIVLECCGIFDGADRSESQAHALHTGKETSKCRSFNLQRNGLYQLRPTSAGAAFQGDSLSKRTRSVFIPTYPAFSEWTKLFENASHCFISGRETDCGPSGVNRHLFLTHLLQNKLTHPLCFFWAIEITRRCLLPPLPQILSHSRHSLDFVWKSKEDASPHKDEYEEETRDQAAHFSQIGIYWRRGLLNNG